MVIIEIVRLCFRDEVDCRHLRLRPDNNDSRRVGTPKVRVRQTQATWKISENVWRDLKYGNEPL